MKSITQEISIGGRSLTFEYGWFAQQANSGIIARYGDTMVLVTVVASPLKAELDYFPLTVDYMEKLYAGGKIKGSRWVKREGRPSDDEILSARLIDRSIRPLFPKNYKKEVQVVATVLSVDGENDPVLLSLIATSAALATSSIPWKGPIGALRIGVKDGTYFANPTSPELEFSELDLVLSCGRENVIMVEALARQVPEEKLVQALSFGQNEAQKIIVGIDELAKKVGVEKDKVQDPKDKELVGRIDKKLGSEIESFAKSNSSKEGGFDSQHLKAAILEEIGENNAPLASSLLDAVLKKRVRAAVLVGKRLDGRKLDQIREIESRTSLLPRTHGSAIFRRGQTQVLTTTTLGSPNLEQLIETAEGEETKRYMHHYAMPPYATGETGRIGSPSRREIGHGALSEKALLPVIPKKDTFPYTIRVVSEVLSSNGSTSMASVCGSTLSLMDAGVPILSPVSGIAMGLVLEGEKVAIISDIVGMEDGCGDMDFKVAGTKDGVTAIQLDVKTDKLTVEILEKALEQANKGRLSILEKMLSVLPKPRAKLSKYAPKISVVNIPVEKIGEVIGPGGKMIRRIMLETGAEVDVEDDGSVTISGISQEAVDSARSWVEGMFKEVKAGDVYEGLVKRIQSFGAFVEVLPGKEGLVHISDLSDSYVGDPNEVVSMGQKVKVRVKEIDDLGRINLTMRERDDKKAMPEGAPRERRDFARQPGGGRGGFRGRDREDRSRERRGPSRAPHFPASRYLPRDKRF